METTTLRSQNDVTALADAILEILSQKDTATVIALHGELGAGKTTFVKALGERLGVAEPITSPTFVLMKYYDIRDHAHFKRLVHIDAYRLEDAGEAKPLRLQELMDDPQNLICIEWAERVADILEEDRLEVTFTHGNEANVREVTYGFNR